MYGMKMRNDDGSIREASRGEKILLAPFAGILWLDAKKIEAEVRKRNDSDNQK